MAEDQHFGPVLKQVMRESKSCLDPFVKGSCTDLFPRGNIRKYRLDKETCEIGTYPHCTITCKLCISEKR